MIALVAAASAHVPHDTAVAFVGPRGLDPAAPWQVLTAPHEVPLFEVSDDAGTTWTIAHAEPTGDLLIGGTSLDDGTLVLAAEGRVWWSADGSTWSSEPAPFPVSAVIGGDRLVLLGEGGAWGGAPGGLVQESETPFVRAGPGPAGVDADGRVWSGVDGAWTQLPPLEGEVSAVAAAPGVTVVGTRTGRVLRLEGSTWTACGGLQLPEGGAPDVVRLLVDGERVWAAAASRGAFVSEDGCATWLERPTPVDPYIGDGGGASSADTTWVDLHAAGDSAVLLGWAGVFATVDGGLSWTEGPTVSSSYLRGLALAPDFATSGRMDLGTYGAAIVTTVDGGRTVAPRDGGFTDTNAQQVVWLGARQLAVENHLGWVSDDGGASWSRVLEEVVRVASFVPHPGGREVWAFTLDEGQAVYRSLDGGEDWHVLAAVPSYMGSARAESVAWVDDGVAAGTRCVTGWAPYRVVCTPDGGRTWFTRYESASAQGAPAVGWPPSRPSRVVAADETGARFSDDGGRRWRTAAWRPGSAPVLLDARADGALAAFMAAGSVAVSLDGGATWSDLPVVLPTRARTVVGRPDGVDEWLVGTAAGGWILRGAATGAASLVRWGFPDRVEAGSGFADRGLGVTKLEVAEAGMGDLHLVPAGSRLCAWVQGDGVRVEGRSGAAATLEVDGAPLVNFAGTGELGPMVSVELGAWGWHQACVLGIGDPAVEVDVIEGTSTGEWPADPVARESAGCASMPRGPGRVAGLGGLLLGIVGLGTGWARARVRRPGR